MLTLTDPFRDLVRDLEWFTDGVFGSMTRPAVMPMDAYQVGDNFYIHLDLPGVDPKTIDLTVEDHVLTVTAERHSPAGDDVRMQVAERPTGRFSRQLFLGEILDLDHIEASYDAGVLTLRIPLAEQAKPRKIEIMSGERPAISA